MHTVHVHMHGCMHAYMYIHICTYVHIYIRAGMKVKNLIFEDKMILSFKVLLLHKLIIKNDQNYKILHAC